MKSKILVSILWGAVVAATGYLAAQDKPVDPVNWRELVSLLVDMPGYEAEKAEGATATMNEFKISTASRDYRKGDIEVHIQIMDGGYFPAAYASYKAMENFEIDTSEQLIRKVTVQGVPGIESIDHENKSAMVLLLVSDRFLVTIDGKPLGDSAALKDIAGRLDLKKLASLGK